MSDGSRPISILQKETLPPYVTSLYGSLPPLPLESGSRERKGIVRTAVVQKPRSLMTNISGGQFLRGNNRAGIGDKTPFQAGGRHPRLEFCFLVPGPGRQADKRLEAQFIFWFLMRGGGQRGSRPSYATCSPSAEVGAGLDKPARLSFSCSLDLVLNERREW